jgi:serine/threonine protein kinase
MKSLRRGGRLGKYRLDRRLGLGASASVWRARDQVEGRVVALKIVQPAVVEEFGRRAIENEARLAARLDHENILAIRNADWIDPYFVIVTEVAQRSLDSYATARRSPALALSIVRDVASALAYAHGRRILHRDVKPANILLFPGQVAKLSDFGTARFAPQRTGILTEVGTMGYMSPEQAYGRAVYASDVFSLGLTAYELLTGRLPTWPFKWPFEADRKFRERTPEPVRAVIRRACEVDLRHRYKNAGQMLTSFDRALKRSAPAKQKVRSSRKKSRPAADPFELETRWFLREYGRRLSLDYECHGCGGPISEAMKHCPWCGSDRNSFLEITRYPLVCPDCERGVRPEWKACPWCYAGRFESNGRSAPKDKQAKRKCRKQGCDGQLRPFMRYCPTCKAKVVRAWSEHGLPPCKKCRWPMAPRWRHCPWCGRTEPGALHIKRS